MIFPYFLPRSFLLSRDMTEYNYSYPCPPPRYFSLAHRHGHRLALIRGGLRIKETTRSFKNALGEGEGNERAERQEPGVEKILRWSKVLAARKRKETKNIRNLFIYGVLYGPSLNFLFRPQAMEALHEEA